MFKILILLLLALHQEPEPYVPSIEEYVSPHDDMRTPIHVTWYINPNNNRTASGGMTFKGSCAASKDHIGDIAAIYSSEGYFIGYFDCNDTGGATGIKNGTTIDIYADSLDEIYRAAEEWGTEFQIVWIKAEG